MKPDDFNTPALPETTAPVAVDNTGKTDELSLAVAAETQRNAVFVPEEVKAPAKFQLDYFMDGQKFTEKHSTVEQALASVRRLRVLGIVPATSTL